jgi:nitrite reductase (NO-forming)/hydroxylamine reductase
MPNWGTSGDLTPAQVDIMARFLPRTTGLVGYPEMMASWKVLVAEDRHRATAQPRRRDLFA